MQIVNVVEQRVYITEEEIRRCLGLPLQDSTDNSLETIYQLADAVIAVSRDERKLCLIWRRTERKRQLSADITREAQRDRAEFNKLPLYFRWFLLFKCLWEGHEPVFQYVYVLASGHVLRSFDTPTQLLSNPRYHPLSTTKVHPDDSPELAEWKKTGWVYLGYEKSCGHCFKLLTTRFIR